MPSFSLALYKFVFCFSAGNEAQKSYGLDLLQWLESSLNTTGYEVSTFDPVFLFYDSIPDVCYHLGLVKIELTVTRKYVSSKYY